MKEFYLANYKSLCAEIDDISDQMQKLSQELDTLEDGTMKYQVQGVADEYNRTKGPKAVRQKTPTHALMEYRMMVTTGPEP
ncbi:occludin isoform X2 [Salmo salar]|uniref:Occludin isoform X2 n=1 Tax=Salmo salar TaxID=8030 RepID=A0A1S3LWL9_SALSA|nr:occludin-like isoform X2 [Salmo salar]|eukprot:XP_013995332.1 PREDICTED: occludin-like isoform X2 [Salmo salar]